MIKYEKTFGLDYRNEKSKVEMEAESKKKCAESNRGQDYGLLDTSM